MGFTAFLGMGSNLGDRATYLREGLRILEKKAGKIIRVSSFYETEPWGVENQENYLNLVVRLETFLLPLGLLRVLQQTELECGRERKERWGSRTLDIDLLFFEDYRFAMPDLTVPHPRLQERNFVLHPMAEIAPDWIHPKNRLTLTQLKETSPDTGGISPCEYS